MEGGCLHTLAPLRKWSHKSTNLNFRILLTNLAIGSTIFIGIMNQLHYINSPFNFELSTNLLIWCSYLQLYKMNIMDSIFVFRKNATSCTRFSLIISTTTSTKILIDLSHLIVNHVCSVSLYVITPVTLNVSMILKIIPLDMVFDVSKYPFCSIEKWTI